MERERRESAKREAPINVENSLSQFSSTMLYDTGDQVRWISQLLYGCLMCDSIFYLRTSGSCNETLKDVSRIS